ncbi:MAG: hypothetical protein PQJ58_11065 [Spirochaetales bacterium]|nr:hypothetical protein [Spirochaetales bacterium]
MSLVVILYLAFLTVFTLGYLYKGVNLLKHETDEAGKKRISYSLKAQEGDVVDFDRFRKFNGRLLIVNGLLHLLLLALTFLFVPNLSGSLTTREIHLIRTLIIAALWLYFGRDMVLATVRERFTERGTSSPAVKYDPKLTVAFIVLSATLGYSIYTQLTYIW